MNKIFKSALFFATAVLLGFTSCGSDDDNNSGTTPPSSEVDPQNLDYTPELAAAWGNYTINVDHHQAARLIHRIWTTPQN